MDEFGQFPLTLAALEARLRRGEVFSIEGRGTDEFTYALSFQDGRFLLRQGGDLHSFRQVQPAVLTLLNCLGEFSCPVVSRGEPEKE